jgi:hypothetical protein
VAKLSRTIAIVTVGASLLAAGSAFAVKTMALPGLTPSTGWTCSAALWRAASDEVPQLSLVGCNGWTLGHSGTESARADGLDLSTLPIMR